MIEGLKAAGCDDVIIKETVRSVTEWDVKFNGKDDDAAKISKEKQEENVNMLIARFQRQTKSAFLILNGHAIDELKSEHQQRQHKSFCQIYPEMLELSAKSVVGTVEEIEAEIDPFLHTPAGRHTIVLNVSGAFLEDLHKNNQQNVERLTSYVGKCFEAQNELRSVHLVLPGKDNKTLIYKFSIANTQASCSGHHKSQPAERDEAIEQDSDGEIGTDDSKVVKMQSVNKAYLLLSAPIGAEHEAYRHRHMSFEDDKESRKLQFKSFTDVLESSLQEQTYVELVTITSWEEMKLAIGTFFDQYNTSNCLTVVFNGTGGKSGILLQDEPDKVKLDDIVQLIQDFSKQAQTRQTELVFGQCYGHLHKEPGCDSNVRVVHFTSEAKPRSLYVVKRERLSRFVIVSSKHPELDMYAREQAERKALLHNIKCAVTPDLPTSRKHQMSLIVVTIESKEK